MVRREARGNYEFICYVLRILPLDRASLGFY